MLWNGIARGFTGEASTAGTKKAAALFAQQLLLRVSLNILQTVLVLELLNTSAALSELLLSCKERMAGGANIGSDFFLCGLGHERIAACASNFTFLELRMDSLFHAVTSFLILRRCLCGSALKPIAACRSLHSIYQSSSKNQAFS